MKRAELLFDAESGVAEARNCHASSGEVVEVIGKGEAKLGSLQETVTESRFRKIRRMLTLRVAEEKAVFDLEAAQGDDDAGIGHGGAVGGDGHFAWRGCLSAQRRRG